MPAPPITLSAFQGEQPRVIPRLMPETAAQSAVDSRLDDGGLTPFRESVFVAPGLVTWQTIYRYMATWLGWDYEVDVAPGPVAANRIYYTGDGPDPAPAKMRVGLAPGDVYNLAVPGPLTALTATLSGPAATAGADIYSRLYIYTYVTNIGGITEESEPSPVSNSVDWQTPRTVTLSGFTAPVAGRGVATQRIYRLQTGTAGSYYYFIHERAVTTADYVDNIPVDASAEPCPSISFNVPPLGLKGLVSMPNGIMAAFKGKELFFCEPYKPHAWPEKYALTTDYEIVALGAMGTSLVVATVGQPYMVSGTHPGSMAMQKIEQNLPCINSKSMVDLGYAVAYATNEGLVVARADGGLAMATSNIFNRRDWAALTPETMVCAQYDGRYVAFYDTLLLDGTRDRGALFIDMSGQSFLIRSNTDAQACYHELETSSLFYIPIGKTPIRQLDAPGALAKYQYWKSKEFVLPYPENYGAFLIDGIISEEEIDIDAVQAQIDAIVASNNTRIIARYTGDSIVDAPHTGYHDMITIGGEINGVWQGLDPVTYPTNNPALNQPPRDIRDIVFNAEIVGGMNSAPVNGDWLTPLPRGATAIVGGGDSTAPPGVTTIQVGIFADKKQVYSVTHANRPVRLPSGFLARTWEIDVYSNGRVYHMTLAKTMDDLKRTP